MTALGVPATRFVLPAEAEATEPPERRGVARDGVRLLVASPDGIEHRRFDELPEVLSAGDVLVVNTSATVPAALDVVDRQGRPARLHVSTALDDGSWVVEPRRPDGPDRDASAGDRFVLPGGVALELRDPHPPGTPVIRLWRARLDPAVPATSYLAAHGRPIGYRYLEAPPALDDLQNVYAVEPGSAEMPSAGRPLTAAGLVRLMARGVVVAPVVLHAGVSSPEKHEPPAPEWFRVPAATARLVDRAPGRVVAVGTTVVRALESVTGPDGTVSAGEGWTDLVLGPRRPARVVTGLISGLHPPEASHLLLLEAVAGQGMVPRAYDAAVREGYRWHEFGDSTLFLP